jgi:hypothetical protein
MTPKRFFYSLSGEDFSIIRKSSESVKTHFAIIGALVGIISLLCFVSFALVFTNLISSLFFGLLMSIFFTWMMVNLYVLVLYTLSKNVLPEPLSRAAILAPTIIKYGFIILLSLFVAKPLELLIFNSKVESDLSLYKKTYQYQYIALCDQRFNTETEQAQTIIQNQKQLNLNSVTSSQMINDLEIIITQKRKERDLLVNKMQGLISESDFYTQRIIILCSKHPLSWICTLIIMCLFLAPATIKYLSIGNEYYQLKKEIETKMVIDDYHEFTRKYNEIIQLKFGENYFWRELYVDPPFNTQRVEVEKKANPEKDLIDLIYHG